jgi:glycosyltransferase involved in cell wall biosynthesis
VELDVLFLSDIGLHPGIDPEFGLPFAWDIDLLSDYSHSFLTNTKLPTSLAQKVRTFIRWLPSHDAIVINGYNSPWMLLAMMLCRMRGIPYILRASSHPNGKSTGIRRYMRRVGTRIVVAGATGGLVMGQLNREFYRQNRAKSVTFAPNSVDDERFARAPRIGRSDLLAQWGMTASRPVILFCGKLIARKRPLDLTAAIGLLPSEVTVLFVGDGPMADDVRAALIPGRGVVTGFVNQTDLPSYYHAADILVLPSDAETWGLVVNEAMACGTLPVVSDQVGCAPDLASGIGEIFRCGDVPGLAASLRRAIARLDDPGTRDRVRQHAARFSLDRTAEGFELAAHKAVGLNSSDRLRRPAPPTGVMADDV